VTIHRLSSLGIRLPRLFQGNSASFPPGHLDHHRLIVFEPPPLATGNRFDRGGVNASCPEIPKVVSDQPGNCVISHSKASPASAGDVLAKIPRETTKTKDPRVVYRAACT